MFAQTFRNFKSIFFICFNWNININKFLQSFWGVVLLFFLLITKQFIENNQVNSGWCIVKQCYHVFQIRNFIFWLCSISTQCLCCAFFPRENVPAQEKPFPVLVLQNDTNSKTEMFQVDKRIIIVQPSNFISTKHFERTYFS